jgi:hypothetical protein
MEAAADNAGKKVSVSGCLGVGVGVGGGVGIGVGVCVGAKVCAGGCACACWRVHVRPLHLHSGDKGLA